jgi:DNA-binding CsgD family transcriptional regulator
MGLTKYEEREVLDLIRQGKDDFDIQKITGVPKFIVRQLRGQNGRA